MNLPSSSPIYFWNRHNQCEEVEAVYGDRFLKWAYSNSLGLSLTDRIFSKAWVSQIYGAYQSTWLSRFKIKPFVKKFKINMEEFEEGPFSNFNEFFIRKFKPSARAFINRSNEMPAFAEARYLAYEKILPDQKFPVKGSGLSAIALMGGEEKAKPFINGPLLLARLCPVDYHRFHFPDSGSCIEDYRVTGGLHSVNPLALKSRAEIFVTNERHVSILETENFGKLAYIEVGALCVGKIVQTFSKNSFQRGDEKGYFLFGASTVIVLGQPGAWKPDSDLLEQTSKQRETFVRLGERVAGK